MIDLTSYRNYIWDWNGTLLDDVHLCLEIANGMLARRALPTMGIVDYRRIFDFPVEQYYRRAGFDLTAEPFLAIADEFIGEYNRRFGECSVHEGADALLRRLSDDGQQHVVLSASRQESLTTAIRRFGLEDRFSAAWGLTDHLAVSKLDVGREMISTLNWDPRETVFIGDTVHDYEVAGALGTDCVLVAVGHHSHERLAATGAPVLSSLADAIA